MEQSVPGSERIPGLKPLYVRDALRRRAPDTPIQTSAFFRLLTPANGARNHVGAFLYCGRRATHPKIFLALMLDTVRPDWNNRGLSAVPGR